jgi:hypothetical protein
MSTKHDPNQSDPILGPPQDLETAELNRQMEMARKVMAKRRKALRALVQIDRGELPDDIGTK